jgi:hypothetical protein
VVAKSYYKFEHGKLVFVPFVEVLDSVMSCDLGSICAKTEQVKNLFVQFFPLPMILLVTVI